MAIDIIRFFFKKTKTKHLKICHTKLLGITISIKLNLVQKYYKLIIMDSIYIAVIVFNFMQ